MNNTTKTSEQGVGPLVHYDDHMFVYSQDHPAFWALPPWPMESLVTPSQVRRGGPRPDRAWRRERGREQTPKVGIQHHVKRFCVFTDGNTQML